MIKKILSPLTTLIIIILLACFVRGTIFEPYKIPSESMVPTLQIGDHIVVTKFDFGFRLAFIKNTLWQYATPKRGQIVVFTRPDDPISPEDDSKINLIKRVIALPGDRIKLVDSKLFINDEFINENYAQYLDGGIGNFQEKIVPEGKVMVLGDNRDHSKDSRFWTDSFLPISLIKGRARFVFFNLNMFSRIGTILTRTE